MDKYSRQAGDSTYDSDAEADDEFERSVFTSPTLPAHFADDDYGSSEHPSESEEEHGSINGEDTPTTQGWTDREGRSPTGSILQWTLEQAADYIASLSPALKQYAPAMQDEGIDGAVLVDLGHDELRELGIISVGHRLTILRAVYEQKIRSGVKIKEDDYVPLSAEGERGDMSATQDDIARVIESIRLRDERIIAAEKELKVLRQDLDRIADENRKLREETLPIMRLVKDQRTPLPDPSGGTIPSPRDFDFSKQNENLAPVKESKGSSLSRKFSTKKLFLGTGPKQPSPTHPPQSHNPQPREVRDDGGAHLEASAAAMAASSHLTASMASQTSPNSFQGSQMSPTSPAYSTHAPSSGGSYQHQPGSAATRSFPRDGTAASARHDPRGYASHTNDETGTGYSATSNWSSSTAVPDSQASTLTSRDRDRMRRQAPTPSPREDETPGSGGSLPRERDRDRGERDRHVQPYPITVSPSAAKFYLTKGYANTTTPTRGDRDNPQVEIFKSFRVSIDDPCRVVLPVVHRTIFDSYYAQKSQHNQPMSRLKQALKAPTHPFSSISPPKHVHFTDPPIQSASYHQKLLLTHSSPPTQALKRYNITDDWRQYALYIVHGDQERCLGLEEKPLLLFKQLDKEGRKPMFMLRRHASPQEGWSGSTSTGGTGVGGSGGGGGGGGGGSQAQQEGKVSTIFF